MYFTENKVLSKKKKSDEQPGKALRGRSGPGLPSIQPLCWSTNRASDKLDVLRYSLTGRAQGSCHLLGVISVLRTPLPFYPRIVSLTHFPLATSYHSNVCLSNRPDRLDRLLVSVRVAYCFR